MQVQKVQTKIYEIRGQKVMLDYDLAELYEVETKALNQSVKRNIERFPEDFMFRLSIAEWNVMRSQIVTASDPQDKRNKNVTPYAFTEQGLAMLSGVLNSQKAIDVNIAIMRAFVKMRQYALNYKELADKLLEHDSKFIDVYEVLDYLTTEKKLELDQKERPRIGFKI